MGGTECLHRYIRPLQGLKHLVQAALPIAHVKYDKSRFPADHSRGAHIAGKTDQLLCGNIRRPVVRERQLQAKDLVHKHNILFHTASDRGGGITIGSAQGKRRNSLLL